jgi:deoxyadenosine/deoxycytidine kinase
VPVIIWINGGFGAGKTTLAEELHRRRPDAVVYDPEEVGLMLWMPGCSGSGSMPA